MATPHVTAFFDHASHTITYVVADPHTRICAVIDPVMDFDLASGKLSTQGIQQVIQFVHENHYLCHWILETHIHADHITASAYLREALKQQEVSARIGIAKEIETVYRTFADVFNLAPNATLNEDFDMLLSEADQLPLGQLSIDVIATPGHTPACLSFYIGDTIFVGDTLFMPDFGSARCDFPNGSAAQLYQSIHKLLALPDRTRMFVGHDYGTSQRAVFAWETTVAAQRTGNIHIRDKSASDFIQAREKRDAQLSLPKLMYPAIRLNLGAGKLPEAEENGRHYLKIPLYTQE